MAVRWDCASGESRSGTGSVMNDLGEDKLLYHFDGCIREIDECRRNLTILTCCVKGCCIP